MERRTFLKSALLGATTAALRAFPARGATPAAPNFLFVLVDDMGWTGLSTPMDDRVDASMSDFYRTPRLAKLAAQGMRFSNAYASASLCTPSRASILTGKSPAALHMTTPGPARGQDLSRKLTPPRHVSQFPTGETTVAEVLRRRGYATAHLGKWHLGGGGPGRHGFDAHDGNTGNGGPGSLADPNPKDIFGITARANAFMEKQANAGEPFYLQLSHYALHSPVQALSKTKGAFATSRRGVRHWDTDYAAMAKDFDTGIGMVLDRLDALGIAENTYVVFMSDNGGGGARKRRENALLSGGKGTLWEGGIRVPLIVRGPNVKAGAFCHANVVGYDLFPTLCELGGVGTLPEGVEGASLVPLLHDGCEAFKRDPDALFFHFPHYGHGPVQVPQSAIISGDLKLIRWHETGEVRLFDLAHDIGEKTNLAKTRREDAEALEARLSAHLTRVNAQMPTANLGYDPTAERSGRQDRRRPRRGKRGPRR